MEKEHEKEYREKIGSLDEIDYKKREIYLKNLANGSIQGPSLGVPSLDKTWNQYYDDASFLKQTPNMNMYDYLYECNKDHLDDVALIFHQKITYRQLFKNIDDVAKGFNKLNIKKGDVVSVAMPYIPETIYTIYALDRLGAICNMCDPRVPADKFKDYVNGVEKISGSKSKTLITLDIVSPKIDKFVNETELKNIIYLPATNSVPKYKLFLKEIKDKIEGNSTVQCNKPTDHRYIEYNKFINEGTEITEFPAYQPNDPCLIVYTSGTSGEPKGALLSNDALNSMALRLPDSIINTERGDKFLLIMPPFIAYGLAIGLHGQLCTGQQLVLVPDFSIDKSKDMVYELLNKYKPQTIMGVPNFIIDLMNHPKAKDMDLSFLKNFIVGGDGISTQTETLGNAFLKSHGSSAVITKGWGMTELSSCVTYSKNEETNKIGSVGVPAVAVDMRILKSNGENINNIDDVEECKYNETGEIFTYAPTEMLGYLDKSKQENVFYDSKDGKTYVRSGDLGRITEDGTVYIDGRIKRIIIRPDGHNISPFAIENIINSDSRIKHCAVVGRAADGYDTGKWAVAYIELKDEFKNMGAEEEIIANIKKEQCEKLPPRDVADFFEFVDNMPLTDIGKIDYKTLEKLENSNEEVKYR